VAQTKEDVMVRHHIRPWQPVEATGYGRRDWAVHGDCTCPDPVEADCDGSCNVPVCGGLTEEEAMEVCGMGNMRQVEVFLTSLGDRFYRSFDGRLRPNLDSPNRV